MTSGSDISSIKQNIVKSSQKHLSKRFKRFSAKVDSERRHYCEDKLTKLVSKILDIGVQCTLSKLKDDSSKKMEINQDLVEKVSNKFKRDIYFIDCKTRGLNRELTFPNCIKQRKSIILLRLSPTQYEIVGRLIPGRGRQIQREFTFRDSLIQSLYKSVMNEESDKYSSSEKESDSESSFDFNSPRNSPSHSQSSSSSRSSSPEHKSGRKHHY